MHPAVCPGSIALGCASSHVWIPRANGRAALGRAGMVIQPSSASTWVRYPCQRLRTSLEYSRDPQRNPRELMCPFSGSGCSKLVLGEETPGLSAINTSTATSERNDAALQPAVRRRPSSADCHTTVPVSWVQAAAKETASQLPHMIVARPTRCRRFGVLATLLLATCKTENKGLAPSW